MSSFLSRHQFCATITVAFMLGVIASPLAGEEVTQPSTSSRYELRRSNLPAFPGAEGGGSRTSGGRGGKVLLVTNLDDAGPGSLRAAIETPGPRFVVFRVAGIIALKTPLAISHPFITIAGQSAPGDGICIRGETTEINTHDVVIRYLRLRRGNLKRRDDGLGGNPAGNIIIDHVSASWGLDENLSLYRHMAKSLTGGPDDKLAVENLTIQWCISSEALDLNNHAFGGTWGGRNCSFHHNLFACNTGRNPSIGMGGGFDFRNNVIFNWRHRTMDGGDGSSRVNVVNNYYKPGPATPPGGIRFRICKAQARNSRDRFPGFGQWFVDGNFVDGYPAITANNWAGGVQYDEATKQKDEIVPAGSEADVRSRTAFSFEPIRTESAVEAFESVLAFGGTSHPRRDAVDARVMEIVRTGKPTFEEGILVTPADVGGWPEYTAGQIPADSDNDGLPDDWERANQLNPNNAADATLDADRDGYVNIEEFLNGTNPREFVDYANPENNRNPYHAPQARK